MRRIYIHQATEQTIDRMTAEGDYAAKDRAGAESIAPWAAEVVEVEGGWVAYESVEDARTAAQQQ